MNMLPFRILLEKASSHINVCTYVSYWDNCHTFLLELHRCTTTLLLAVHMYSSGKRRVRPAFLLYLLLATNPPPPPHIIYYYYATKTFFFFFFFFFLKKIRATVYTHTTLRYWVQYSLCVLVYVSYICRVDVLYLPKLV